MRSHHHDERPGALEGMQAAELKLDQCTPARWASPAIAPTW
ncbi:MAG: hypothetical protein ACREBE_26390 [bacterium]